MTVFLLGRGASSFQEALTEAQIPFTPRTPQPGVPMNSGDALEIAAQGVPAAAAIALVVRSWLQARASRKVTFHPNGKIMSTEGFNVEECQRFIGAANGMTVFDTSPAPKNDNPFSPPNQ